jgi:hypothetical protein
MCHLAQDEAEDRAARARAAEAAEAATAEAPAEAAADVKTTSRPPRPPTHQPWKRAALQSGFHQKVRTPRKVGGS